MGRTSKRCSTWGHWPSRTRRPERGTRRVCFKVIHDHLAIKNGEDVSIERHNVQFMITVTVGRKRNVETKHVAFLIGHGAEHEHSISDSALPCEVYWSCCAALWSQVDPVRGVQWAVERDAWLHTPHLVVAGRAYREGRIQCASALLGEDLERAGE